MLPLSNLGKVYDHDSALAGESFLPDFTQIVLLSATKLSYLKILVIRTVLCRFRAVSFSLNEVLTSIWTFMHIMFICTN